MINPPKNDKLPGFRQLRLPSIINRRTGPKIAHKRNAAPKGGVRRED